MPKQLFIFFLPLFALLFFASCSFTSLGTGAAPTPLVGFSHLERISVSVASIVTQEPPLDSIKGVFLLSPEDLMRKYMHQRFMPVGRSGKLVGQIESASLSHEYESADNRFGRFLSVAGHDVYHHELVFRIEHVSEGRVVFGKKLTVQHTLRVSEHASLAERDRLQVKALAELFDQLDQAILKIVRDEMRLALPEMRREHHEYREQLQTP